MANSSNLNPGIFDTQTNDPRNFWQTEIYSKPEVLDYEGGVFIKTKNKLQNYSEKWMGIKGSFLYFGDVVLKNKAKTYKFLNLRQQLCKLYECVLDIKKKNRYRMTLHHHSYSQEFCFAKYVDMTNWIKKLRNLVILCDLIEKYSIVKSISFGRISKHQTVWVKSTDKDKEYIAKIYYLTPENDMQHKTQAKLERQIVLNEVKALLSSDHPNIVKLKEIHEFKDSVVLLVEFIEGNSLLNYISARHSISEQDTAFIIKILLTTIKYLHEKGIIHRNLSSLVKYTIFKINLFTFYHIKNI